MFVGSMGAAVCDFAHLIRTPLVLNFLLPDPSVFFGEEREERGGEKRSLQGRRKMEEVLTLVGVLAQGLEQQMSSIQVSPSWKGRYTSIEVEKILSFLSCIDLHAFMRFEFTVKSDGQIRCSKKAIYGFSRS